MNYVRAGRIDFRAALARVAEIALPQAWEAAKAADRGFLTYAEPPRGFVANVAAREGSLAALAYAKLRPTLAEGTLPSLIRMRTGSPQRIVPASWEAESADRLTEVIAGRASFELEGGAVVTGAVLINAVDLETVLRGEPVSAAVSEPTIMPALRSGQSSRRGRPENPDNDLFWIEACRRIYQGVSFEPQKDFASGLLEWAEANMKRPHDEGTVRKKVSLLVAALKRPD